ncbi:MAG: VacJ family lipoprotein [Deltaproteobacteria bacterium]|nr:MAG: VacJ family lipoprotein [Deltaproteobacteria bacterium]
MKSWFSLLPVVFLIFVSGCASRQAQSPPPSVPQQIVLASTTALPLTEAEKPVKPAEVVSPDEDFDEFDEIAEWETMEKPLPDPLEPINRFFFNVNDKLYFWLLKPFAKIYTAVVPVGVQVAVENFFINVATPIRFSNCILQLNFQGAAIELSRVMVNTSIGLFGLLDPAGKGLGLPRFQEDFGQTMGFYGVGPGFYLNLPITGPTTLRDSLGTVADSYSYYFTPTQYLSPLIVVGIRVYQVVNKTSLSLGDYEDLIEMSLDPYIALRNAYHQLRQKRIHERFLIDQDRDLSPPPSHRRLLE